MNTVLPEANGMISALKSERQIIDCDVHTYFPSMETLLDYLPERWRDHHKTYGASGFHSGVGGRYPRRTRSPPGRTRGHRPADCPGQI